MEVPAERVEEQWIIGVEEDLGGLKGPARRDARVADPVVFVDRAADHCRCGVFVDGDANI